MRIRELQDGYSWHLEEEKGLHSVPLMAIVRPDGTPANFSLAPLFGSRALIASTIHQLVDKDFEAMQRGDGSK